MKEDLVQAMRRARASAEKAAEADTLRLRVDSSVPREELAASRAEAVRLRSEISAALLRAESAEGLAKSMVPAVDHSAALELAAAEAGRASSAEERIVELQVLLLRCAKQSKGDNHAGGCPSCPGSVLGLDGSISQSPILNAESSPSSQAVEDLRTALLLAQRHAEGLAAEVLPVLHLVLICC
jgi:hypothetical protein